MLNQLSLFTGYAGFELGLKLAGVKFKTVCYCEIEPYCQKIIQARIKDGYLDDAPIWNDIRTLDGMQFRGLVDIITGGFPCQPHSVAGRRLGAEDSRDLWPDYARLIRGIRPQYVILENVPGINAPTKITLMVLKIIRKIGLFGERNNLQNTGNITRSIVKSLGQPFVAGVLGDLAEIGYDTIWDCVPAAACGAPHLRWRWWCLAYPRREHIDLQQRSIRSQLEGSGEDVADPQQSGCRKQSADGQGRNGAQSTRLETISRDSSIPDSLSDRPQGQRGGVH